MKQVFTLSESSELELLKNMLEQAGIQCSLRNVQLSQALPATPFDVELWVLNDEDYPKATELCQAWSHPLPDAIGTWMCARCGERLRQQFDSCWKCGAVRKPTVRSGKEVEGDENFSWFVD